MRVCVGVLFQKLPSAQTYLAWFALPSAEGYKNTTENGWKNRMHDLKLSSQEPGMLSAFNLASAGKGWKLGLGGWGDRDRKITVCGVGAELYSLEVAQVANLQECVDISICN